MHSPTTEQFRYKILCYFAKMIAPSAYSKLCAYERPMINFVKRKFGRKPLIGVEIGVAEGKNAESILKNLNVKRLYLVDPYVAYYDHEWLWTHYIHREPEAHERLRNFKDKIVWLKSLSSNTALSILEPLDFVYIDGNHTFEFCYVDITNYYPLVREGGVIGGHNFEGQYPGVVRAVSLFSHYKRLKYQTERVDWWIVK